MFLTFPPHFRPTVDASMLRPSIHLIDRLISQNMESSRQGPALDVREDEHAFHIAAELPGQNIDDVEVEIHGKAVTLSGTRMAYAGDGVAHEGEKTLLREQWSGEYTRTLRLPEAVDADKVTCALHSGVLRLRLPKKAPNEKRKLRLQDIPQMNAA